MRRSEGASGGAVLRGVPLDPRPVVLRTPAVREAAGAPAATPAAPPPGAAPVSADSLPGYAEGFREGRAEGEAAQRARELEEIEAHRRRAFEQGREEGRLRGIAEGREQGRAAVEREGKAGLEAIAGRLTQLDRLLASLPAELTRRLGEAEEDMVALCHAVVCRILGDELRTPEGVAQLVRQAIRDAGPAGFGRGHGQLAIHLHPRDLAVLEGDAALAAWLRQHATADAVQWVPDERVATGGCLVRSAEGSLDARLETQLEALRALLTDRRPAQAAAPRPAGNAGAGGAA